MLSGAWQLSVRGCQQRSTLAGWMIVLRPTNCLHFFGLSAEPSGPEPRSSFSCQLLNTSDWHNYNYDGKESYSDFDGCATRLKGGLRDVVGSSFIIREEDAEEVEGCVFWLERLQLSGLVWYEALAAYAPESLLTTRLILIRLNGWLVCATV